MYTAMYTYNVHGTKLHSSGPINKFAGLLYLTRLWNGKDVKYESSIMSAELSRIDAQDSNVPAV